MGLRSTLAIAALVAACGDNLEPEPDVDSTVVIALETMAPAQVAAGDTISISCTLLENEITTMVDADVRVVAEDSVVRAGNTVIAAKVGTIEVACALPGRGLVDPTPVTVEIVHGPAANIVTTIAPDPVVAGNSATATCVVYDAYGNLVEDSETPTLALSPMDAANTVTGHDAFMTRAGHYTARCELPGTTTNNAGFDVIPNLPASLAIARFPDLPVYAIGNVVDVTHIVTDRYGNEIALPSLSYAVTPITGVGPIVDVGPGSWRFHGEGRYRVDVTVNPPTDMDIPLTANVEFIVNSRGPAVACNNDAAMLTLTPGAPLAVSGTVADVNGVDTLTVNGTPVTVASDGSFATSVTSRFGINFVDVSATDTFGEPTTVVCTFLVSNRYANPANTIADTVSLKLTQNAVDDANRTGDPDALADLLHAVLNSAGLSNTLHNTLLASNPIKPSSCDSQTCTFLGCICWISSRVDYLDRSLPGPNTVSLTLVTNGMRAQVRIDNPAIRLRVRGSVSGIPYDTTGWVTFDYIDIGVTLDPTLTQAGQLDVNVRPGSVTTNVGSISTNFSGLDGWIINNIIVPLAQGSLRDAMEDILADFISSNFNAALDGVIGGLSIASLGTTFNVPRLDGSGSIPLSFGLGFSTLSTSTARMLFGIGTRFSGGSAHAIPSSGVALPPGNNLLDMSLFSPANTGVAAHVGVLNGALHALWRAGFLSAAIDASVLGSGVPSGTDIVVDAKLPPVAFVSGNQIHLHLGAIDLTVQHPALPPDLGVRVGADATGSITLVGNDLSFGGITLTNLYLSTTAFDLTAQQQMDLEDTLIVLLQQIVDGSLNDALPALPIPSFAIPTSLNTFGLPGGRRLGLVSPGLTVTPQHFILRGQFGLLPP